MGSEFWTINNNNMPVMTTTTYIGIHKSDQDCAKLSVNENIKKTRRTTYSLMGSGFHGRNGLDRETIISLIKTYVLPVLTYGLEIVLPSGKNMECLQMYFKKLLKQLLSLPNNVADISIYILSGLLPIEAEIHLKALSLFGNITRAKRSSVELKLADRQLLLKNRNNHSWFVDIKKICLKYDIQQCYQFLTNPLTKSKWKTLIKEKVCDYWADRINNITRYYSSLKYIEGSYTIGKIHPLLSTNTSCTRDINRIPVRVKLATGTCILQFNRAKFNSGYISPLCKLCNENNEELSHFLLYCPILENERKQLLSQITTMASAV